MPKLKELSQKQADFIQWYTSPASPTYDNITQSAIRAGYSKQYAHKNAHRTLKPLAKKMIEKRAEKTEHAVDRSQFYSDLLQDAEKGIAERVRMDVGKDSKLRTIQQKDQHFVAERIGKDRWASKKIVENQGLFQLNDKALESLANTLNDQLTAQREPIKADYTVKSDELIAERNKDQDKAQ